MIILLCMNFVIRASPCEMRSNTIPIPIRNPNDFGWKNLPKAPTLFLFDTRRDIHQVIFPNRVLVIE